jgi:hypothetical protein
MGHGVQATAEPVLEPAVYRASGVRNLVEEPGRTFAAQVMMEPATKRFLIFRMVRQHLVVDGHGARDMA